MKKNNRAARAARLEVKSVRHLPTLTWSGKQQCEILKPEFAAACKSIVVCLYVKAMRVAEVKRHFTHLVQLNQHGIIPKQLTCRKVLF